MHKVDENVKFLCEVFPDMVRRLVLQAKELEVLGIPGAMYDLAEKLEEARSVCYRWATDTSRELRETHGQIP